VIEKGGAKGPDGGGVTELAQRLGRRRAHHLGNADVVEAGDQRADRVTVADLVRDGALRKKIKLENYVTEKVGLPTLTDIVAELAKPGRDPRQDAPAPILRSDVLKMEDVVTGMRLKGTVRNVVDFGIFVDIGVKQDGLLHRTQIPAGTLLQVGDIIEVIILKVEAERGRISLGMEKP